MCIYMYAYKSVRIKMCVYIKIHIHTHIYIYMRVYVHFYINKQAYIEPNILVNGINLEVVNGFTYLGNM